MSVEEREEIIDSVKLFTEPIFEVINVISGFYTLISFLKEFSLNANNTISLIIFLLSLILMYIMEGEFYDWLRGLIGL